jgi:hypothetical protein
MVLPFHEGKPRRLLSRKRQLRPIAAAPIRGTWKTGVSCVALRPIERESSPVRDCLMFKGPLHRVIRGTQDDRINVRARGRRFFSLSRVRENCWS